MTQQDFFSLSDDMLSDGGPDVPFHKFKNGSHKFRLAPPFDAKNLFWEEWIHWMVTAEGHKRAITCGRRFYKECPLCERRQQLLKHKDHAELTGNVALKQQMQNEAALWSARPTMLWNILLGEDLKVLQISSNGHLELLKKVKFWWEQKRINLTNPQQNYLMYVERTGEKSTTRYTFEVIDSTPPIALQPIPVSLDLSKIYVATPLEDMKKIAETGFAPSYENAKKKADPSAPVGEYQGPMLSQIQTAVPQQATQAPVQQPAIQPAPAPLHPHVNPGSHFHTPPPVTSQAAPQPVAAPAYQQPAPIQPAVTAPVNAAQEAEIANMLATLNGGR